MRRPASPGVFVTAAILLVFLGVAVSVDFPRAAFGFKGDEATYYTLTHSLARDGDFTYQRRDLVRVWEEFSAPEGIFLKKGADIQGAQFTPRPPFVALETVPDPSRSRLYYAKSFAYPLFAAPFVAIFGTSGFLILHALLIGLNFGAAYAFLRVRGSAPAPAATFAAVFLFATVVPVYFVWLTPELFNFTLVLQAYFLWTYKHAAAALPAEAGSHERDRREGDRRKAWLPPSGGRDHLDRDLTRWGRFLRSPSSDLLAAVLLGIATFSKPTHVLLILPLLAWCAWRRQWTRGASIGLLFAAVVASLFGWNAAISGEFNYQGGDRKSFYSSTGFPFANDWETFDSKGQDVATDTVPTDILVHGDTLRVLAWNLLYFTLGRYSGFVPYFFPGVIAVALFLRRRGERHVWQWLTLGTALFGAVALLLYMPYTYSGGGGPVGNRYFLSFYPLFLFVLPAITSLRPALIALAVGALFTAKMVINPFYSSFHAGAYADAGPLRVLPIELTLLNDLPVSGDPVRARRTIAGTPPLSAYFPDRNAYDTEGEFFWVRGGRRADVILRAPAPEIEGRGVVPLRVRRLTVEISNGAVQNRIRVSDGLGWITFDLAPREDRVVEVTPRGGVPFKPSIYPTNYVYALSISTTAGSAPFLDAPGESDDSRYLGARVRLVPIYEDKP